MASSSVVKLVVCLAIMAMVLDAPVAEALTCGQVSSSLVSCITYIKVGGAVPAACCNGVRSLNRAAKTTADRRAACRCLKSSTRIIKGINWKLAAGLPSKCGVHIPYKISPSTNCARVR